MSEDDVRARFDAMQPVDLPDDMAPPAEPPGDGEEPPPHAMSAREPLNDYGNGRRFATHFGEDVMWVPRVGWFHWTGQVWEADPDEIAVRRRAQKVAGIILEEIPHLVLEAADMERLGRERSLREELARLRGGDGGADPDEAPRVAEIEGDLNRIAGIRKRLGLMRRDHRSHAKGSGNTPRITALLKEGGVALARRFEDLDAEHLDVNTETGVLRFSVSGGPGEGFSRTAAVDLVPHARDQLMTKMVPVAYDAAVRAPLFEAFLVRVQPSASMREFLQRWFGYSMLGLTGEQKLVFLHGAGANGKSVLVDVLSRIMGDYAATAKIESLTGRNRRSGGDATPDLVPLMGARFVRASEPEQGERLQEGKIKELTGGEPILVRALQEDFVEVEPRFKLTISGNHKPEVRGTDDGIWRRLLLVPFDVQIPSAERDPLMVEKLMAEAPGILNWLVEGAISYLEGGLAEPAEVLEATGDYRSEQDPMGAFLAERCQVTGRAEDWLSTADLVKGFNLHQQLEGQTTWKERTVALGLKDKAGRWRHPRDGNSFSANKRSVSGYAGIRWTDFFRRTIDEAPRDRDGNPMPRISTDIDPNEAF